VDKIISSPIVEGLVISIIGFFGWLLKRSVYGEMKRIEEKSDKSMLSIKEDTSKAIADLQLFVKGEIVRMNAAVVNNYGKKMDTILCNGYRLGCQNTIQAEIASLKEMNTLILTRQAQVIERIDAALLEMARRKE
jgi:hypothetical protein